MNLSKEIMDKIGDIMEPISKLPQAEFEAAIQTIAIVSLGTIHSSLGLEYYEGFVSGALESPPVLCVKRHQAH
jgi:hypothetical protein